MSNISEAYFHLMHETERALRILVEAQQSCEELYISSEEPVLRLFPSFQDAPEQPGEAPAPSVGAD